MREQKSNGTTWLGKFKRLAPALPASLFLAGVGAWMASSATCSLGITDGNTKNEVLTGALVGFIQGVLLELVTEDLRSSGRSSSFIIKLSLISGAIWGIFTKSILPQLPGSTFPTLPKVLGLATSGALIGTIGNGTSTAVKLAAKDPSCRRLSRVLFGCPPPRKGTGPNRIPFS